MSWECVLETFRLQRDLPEGFEKDDKVKKAIGDELKAWIILVEGRPG